MRAFVLLFVWHALADYPLQGDWLSKAKNHKLALVAGEIIWPLALASHAAVHAVGVAFILQNLWCGVAEFVIHAATDYAKCDGRIGYNTDQFIHIASKAAYVLALAYVAGFGPQ